MTSLGQFDRYVGIDYSGAQTPDASLKGLRVYAADHATEASEILPRPSVRKYWTRRGIAEWLVHRLTEPLRTIVGIDHGFSFPLRYFESHLIRPDWQVFLDDFALHWPTDDDNTYVDFVRDGIRGNGAARMGNSRWRRVCEVRARAKSVFHFDCQGSVAKSTHAGIPWLRFIRQRAPTVHFWPFDGWDIPAGRSAVVEVYPSLWRHQFPAGERNGDQQDAYMAATWMQRSDRDGTLQAALHPALNSGEQTVATVEGWILGVA